MSKLDRYDLSILAELQRDARISNQELAERIGLSPSPCSRRVKQLEDDGYISRQVALLDRKMLGLSLTAYVLIGMDRHTPERFENFEAAIRTLPQVLECSLVTGVDADYQLKVVVPDMDHYQKLLLGHLTRIEGVTSVRSSFVLNQVLNSTELPLTHLRSLLAKGPAQATQINATPPTMAYTRRRPFSPVRAGDRQWIQHCSKSG